MLLVTKKKRPFVMYICVHLIISAAHTLVCPTHSIYHGLYGQLYTHIKRSLKHMTINLHLLSDHAE